MDNIDKLFEKQKSGISKHWWHKITHKDDIEIQKEIQESDDPIIYLKKTRKKTNRWIIYCNCDRQIKAKWDNYCINCWDYIKRKSKTHNKEYIDIFKDFWWDVNVCQKCWNIKWWLQIHHIDKNHNNNHPFNLIKLCLVCHCKEHKWEPVYKLMKSRLDFILNK